MSLGLHFLACFSGGFTENCIEASLLDDEDGRMIKAKSFANEADSSRKYCIKIESGCDKAANFRRYGKVGIAALQRLLRNFSLRDITCDPKHLIFCKF